MNHQKLIIRLIIAIMILTLNVNAQNGYSVRQVRCGYHHQTQFSLMLSKSMLSYQVLSPLAQHDAVVADLTGKIYDAENMMFLFRAFSKNHFALRLGLGNEMSSYTIAYNKTDDFENAERVSANEYSAYRRDLILNIGFEKHFRLSRYFEAFGGVGIPMLILGQPKADDAEALSEYTNRKGFMGIGVGGGLQVKIANLILIGGEVESSFMKVSYSLNNDLEEVDHLGFIRSAMSAKLFAGIFF